VAGVKGLTKRLETEAVELLHEIDDTRYDPGREDASRRRRPRVGAIGYFPGIRCAALLRRSLTSFTTDSNP
jgi:hypothetical protein